MRKLDSCLKLPSGSVFHLVLSDLFCSLPTFFPPLNSASPIPDASGGTLAPSDSPAHPLAVGRPLSLQNGAWLPLVIDPGGPSLSPALAVHHPPNPGQQGHVWGAGTQSLGSSCLLLRVSPPFLALDFLLDCPREAGVLGWAPVQLADWPSRAQSPSCPLITFIPWTPSVPKPRK